MHNAHSLALDGVREEDKKDAGWDKEKPEEKEEGKDDAGGKGTGGR